jgi:sulfatase modifying factor 1
MEELLFMKKTLFIFFLSTLSIYAAEFIVFSLDGKNIGTVQCVENDCSSALSTYSKAVILVDKKTNVSSWSKGISITSEDTVFISLQDSVSWIELEKNSVVSLCIEDSVDGVWKVSGLASRLQNDACIQIDAGKLVKSANVQYLAKSGIKNTFNILVGMKRIDLSSQSHELGFYGSEFSLKEKVIYMDPNKELENRIYPDSVRISSMDVDLAVDKYKVTNCEIIQTLWDSIPMHSKSQDRVLLEYHNYWIDKKKKTIKNGSCDAHDSAAIKAYLYSALAYANARSIRDGFEPVYSFKKINKKIHLPTLYPDGSFDVYTTSFFEKYENGGDAWIYVQVNKNANGYRLPYYDEWMALAKAGKTGRRYVWGNSESEEVASQYAWFGEGIAISEKYGVYKQESKPVGMKKPNDYGLYDMAGLVCENVMFPGKSIFTREITSCKGGFLYDSLKNLNFGAHEDNFIGGLGGYQGLRLVRKLN